MRHFCAMYGNKRPYGIINIVLASIVFLFNLFYLSELFIEFSIVQIPLLPVILIATEFFVQNRGNL